MIGGLRRLVRGETNIDIIGRSRVWALISLAVIVVSLGGLFGRSLNLSLEFSGGTAFDAPLLRNVDAPAVEQELENLELGDTTVQVTREQGSGDRPCATGSATNPTCRLLVRSSHVDPDRMREVRARIAEVAGLDDAGAVNVTDVGPTWGQQVSSKALRGFIVFLVLVSLYISARFEPKMAAAALAALFHDLLATAGVYALVGFEVSPATVIALLTLMGYSLYDTVVVFDKIRENAGNMPPDRSYSSMVNRSVNAVMMRSINTSISSVLPVGGLLFVGVFLFGAVTLRDLALAMFVGTLVSTYSSIFVAAPVLAFLKEREPRYRAARAREAGLERPERPRRPAPAAPTPAAPPAVGDEGEADPRVAAPVTRPTLDGPRAPRGAPRPRKRRRGKRR